MGRYSCWCFLPKGRIMSANLFLLKSPFLFQSQPPLLYITRRDFHDPSTKTVALITSPPSFVKNSFGSCFCHGFLNLDALKGVVADRHASSLSDQGSMAVQRDDEVNHSETVHERPQDEAVVGSIHLIVGPMFAGKTTTLLKRVQAEALAGRNVAMVKSNKDTRYALSSVVSHDGLRMPCWAVSSLARFRGEIGEEAYAKLDVIGIDEAQFLQDLCSFCQVAADQDGKTIIVAGLDGDFSRNRFGSVLELVPLADSVVKLSSRCEMCGKPAIFTFRKTDEFMKEVIGGADVYMPVCRQHYYSGKIAMETARTVLEAQKFLAVQCENLGTMEQ